MYLSVTSLWCSLCSLYSSVAPGLLCSQCAWEVKTSQRWLRLVTWNSSDPLGGRGGWRPWCTLDFRMTFIDYAARKQFKWRKSKHKRSNTMQGAKQHLLPFNRAASWLNQGHSSVSRKYCSTCLIPEVHSPLKSLLMSRTSLFRKVFLTFTPFVLQWKECYR